jgi:hypothetical protein
MIYNHWVGVCYFIPSVRVSFINVELGFSIKNLNFSFLGETIPILFVGSQSVSVKVRIILYQSQVLKSSLLSFYLLFYIILFRLCPLFPILVLFRAPSKKKKCVTEATNIHSPCLSKLIFS